MPEASRSVQAAGVDGAGRNGARSQKTTALAATPNLALLALGALGGQCVWSTEMAFASPYLLHLGMAKSSMAIVFVAGPLSGLIVQPCIGLISDHSTHRWGRRRPLLVVACAITTCALLLLGFARALAGLFFQDALLRDKVTIAFVVASIFAIDFSVNAVNALDRALLLDLVPLHRQSMAYAWAARAAGIGAIVGFLICQTDLTLYFPFRYFAFLQTNIAAGTDATEAQIRCVSLLVSTLLVVTHAVTVIVGKETPLEDRGREHDAHKARQGGCVRLAAFIASMLRDLIAAAKKLPRPILEIFRIHFFLSLGWYPMLFYSTTWVSQIVSQTSSADESTAMRLGSLAMLYHAIISLVCTLVLPSLVSLYKRVVLRRSTDTLTMLWAISNFVLAFALLSTWWAEHKIPAMLLVALTGFPLACSSWAPFALMGILIRKQAEGIDAEAYALSEYTPLPHRSRQNGDSIPLMRRDSTEDSTPQDSTPQNGSHDSQLSSRRNRGIDVEQSDLHQAYQDPSVAAGEMALEGAGKEGATILGLHNVSIVSAHFLMTAYSTIVFAMMENRAMPATSHGALLPSSPIPAPPPQHESDAIGLVLRTGGAASIVAGVFAIRLAQRYAYLLDG